nr:hypothetical protein [Halobellus inordinatus]
MDRNVDDTDEERQPVLVDGDDAHHDEEVKVRLDQAAREVHEDGRSRRQPDRRQRRPGAAAESRPTREEGEPKQDAQPQKDFWQRVRRERRPTDRFGPLVHPECEQKRDVRK